MFSPHRSLPGCPITKKASRMLHNSKPLTTFQPPGSQYFPSATGAHSLQKTVLSLARNLLWLISPLRHSDPLRYSFNRRTRTGCALTSIIRHRADAARLRGTNAAGPTQVHRCKGQHGQMPCPLDCGCQNTLVPGARAGATARGYAASVGNEIAQLCRVFIVDCIRFAGTKGAHFADWRISGSASSCGPRSG